MRGPNTTYYSFLILTDNHNPTRPLGTGRHRRRRSIQLWLRSVSDRLAFTLVGSDGGFGGSLCLLPLLQQACHAQVYESCGQRSNLYNQW